MKKLIGHFCKHSSGVALEVFVVIITFVFLLWGGFLFRLAQGPLNVNFLTDNIEKTINAHAQDMQVNLGQTDLVWDGYRRPFELQIRDVRLFGQNGEPILVVPRLGMRISKRNLVKGDFVPRGIVLYEPAIRIIRAADGRIKLNVATAAAEDDTAQDLAQIDQANQADQTDVITDVTIDQGDAQTKIIENIIKVLRGDMHRDDPLSALRRVVIRRADVVIEDQANGAMWRFKDARLSVSRGRGGLVGGVRGDLLLGDATASLSANLYYQKDTEQTQVVAFLKHFNATDFAEQADFLEDLSAMNAPLHGAMHLVFDKELGLKRGLVQVKGEKGEFQLPQMYKEPIRFTSVALKIPFDLNKKEAQIEDLFVDIGGPIVRGGGQISLDEADRVQIAVDASLNEMPFDRVKDYWPENLTPLPREWVTTHLSKGHVSKATVGLKLSAPKDKMSEVEVHSVGGEIDFAGLQVDYFPPLQKVENVVGRATYSKDDFVLDLKSGRLDDMQVTKSDIVIDGFKEDEPKIDISVALAGSAQTALRVLDSDPLNYPERFNLDPRDIEGQSQIDVNFKFPLSTDLEIEDVAVVAKAKLTDVMLKNAVGDMYLSGEAADLVVNNDQMTVIGEGHLAGAKIKFNWLEHFNETADFRSRIEADLTMDQTIARRMGAPDVLTFDGDAPSAITYTKMFDKSEILFLHSDLTPMGFGVEALNYNKNIGVKGALDVYINLRDGQARSIRNLNLDMEGLKVAGNIELSQDATGKTDWKKAVLSKFEMGYSNIAVEADNEGAAGYKLSVKGATFDARPLLENGDNDQGESDVPAVFEKQTPLRIGVEVTELIAGPQGSIKDTKMFIKRDEYGLIDQFEMDGIAGAGSVYMRYMPVEGGGHKLDFEAEDAGAALSALDVTDSVRGGYLVIDGHPNPNGDERGLMGKAQLSNFRLVNVPVLAQLLNSMSLAGIQELLSGKGIKFSRLKTSFVWDEIFDKTQGRLERKALFIRDGRTSGASLGLNVEGKIDRLTDILDLKGTIVPVSGLNKAVGQIPIVGQILTGGSNAVFAATYTVKGPVSKPTITVNPLAALAPGILRRIFFEGDM